MTPTPTVSQSKQENNRGAEAWELQDRIVRSLTWRPISILKDGAMRICFFQAKIQSHNSHPDPWFTMDPSRLSCFATAIEDIHQVMGGSKSLTDVLLGMLHSHYYQLGISPAPADAHLFCSGSFGGAAIEARQA
ncbi:hypothetical protein PAAG_11843 [Paracoccidioides lutzii Pb01]|uniref:Uncharacterized protein n=1 Tax=Paracoccidioides lutzii (strain ATCC MYA-826 / Pb01) TaxID=502779 RepID=A0A0A2V1W3_PARBA|nr:hypothetical protein PAAG_11843 [Paracoccidioides lutzii Pb01]KGQ01493.1 hypothetical protein PAAG_11843 [Paracoccidioides lutzii Pb01]